MLGGNGSASSSTASGLRGASEAEPLPRKVGEIGFDARETSSRTESTRTVANGTTSPSLEGPHPAERSTPSGHATARRESPSGGAVGSDPDIHVTVVRSKSIGSGTSIVGIRMPTALRLIFAFILLLGLIASWIVVILVIYTKKIPASSGDQSDGGAVQELRGGQILVHVAFGVAALGLLIFLERYIFIARAERYIHTHGDPDSEDSDLGRRPEHFSTQSSAHGFLSFAPWNRPSLPSYAQAVAGTTLRGTGDVEDGIIAAGVARGGAPPAYGNTRGSTLLLRTLVLPNMSRLSRVPSYASRRAHSRASSRHDEVGVVDGSLREDADRARRLEEALGNLEGSTTNARRP